MKIWAKTKEWAEGKFLVVRRDGTVPHWPHFVLGARDPAAAGTLMAYAAIAEELGYEREYCTSIRDLSQDFVQYMRQHGKGDPESPPHREDNPSVIAAMRGEDADIHVVPDLGNEPKP